MFFLIFPKILNVISPKIQFKINPIKPKNFIRKKRGHYRAYTTHLPQIVVYTTPGLKIFRSENKWNDEISEYTPFDKHQLFHPLADLKAALSSRRLTKYAAASLNRERESVKKKKSMQAHEEGGDTARLRPVTRMGYWRRCRD